MDEIYDALLYHLDSQMFLEEKHCFIEFIRECYFGCEEEGE